MEQVSETREIAVGADRVWAMAGDFAGLALWVSGVDRFACTGDGIGAVRTFLLAGQAMEERQMARDDANRSYSYALCRGPVPVAGYRATIAVTPLGPGRSQVTWSASYRPVGIAPERCERLLRSSYRANLERLKDRLESGVPGRPVPGQG